MPGAAAGASVADAEAQTAAWDALKRAERAAKGDADDSALAGIARGMPEWQRAVKLQAKAAKVGFDWPGPEPVIAKLHEEIDEVRVEFAGVSEDADDAAARKKLLDDAEQDGRIDAATRPIYENLLAKDRENGEKALEKLSPKRSVMTDLRVNPTGESPWNKRMSEIKDKLNHK